MKLGQTSRGLRRICSAIFLSCFVAQAGAVTIDFTDARWSDVNGEYSYDFGDFTMYARSAMTFNASDNGGCVGSSDYHDLACDGDGIGIRDDEISQAGSDFHKLDDEWLYLVFDFSVNIDSIELLDLFGKEQSGERAVIWDGSSSTTIDSSGAAGSEANDVGGYYNITSLSISTDELGLRGFTDSFSDYALASITYESATVPEPETIALFGLGLIGLVLSRRLSKQ